MDNTQRATNPLTKYGSVLAVIFCVGGIFPILSYNYQLNFPFWFTFKYLGSITLLSILIVGIIKLRELGWVASIASFVERLMIGGLLCLMSTGYVLIINSSLGNQKEICFSGEIIEKKADRQSGVTTTFILSLKENDEVKRLVVEKQEFDGHEVGVTYSKCWNKGLFGLLNKAASRQKPSR